MIIEDDAQLHTNFRAEAATTLQALPCGWKLLHMCPQFLWERSKDEVPPRFHLNASWSGEAIDADNGKHPLPGSNEARFFRRPTFWAAPTTRRKRFKKRKFDAFDLALGGPTAFIVRRDYAAVLRAMLEASISNNASSMDLVAIDTWFKRNYRIGEWYTAREPQLCRELQGDKATAGAQTFSSRSATSSSWFDGPS